MMKGPEVRARFVESHLNKGIAFQAESLREKRGWTQQELADKLNSSQNSVYRLENPNYGKHTITTLRKVAAAFDVALIVRFAPFSELVDWVSGTPRVEPGLGPNTLDIPSFAEELRQPDERAAETVSADAPPPGSILVILREEGNDQTLGREVVTETHAASSSVTQGLTQAPVTRLCAAVEASRSHIAETNREMA